jgi:tRNA (adenine22-N1)-methyltransferase
LPVVDAVMRGKRERKPGARLEAIIELIGQCNNIYDVGCDHGYMSLELVKRGLAKRIKFSDISAPALEKAFLNAQESGLLEKASFRVADGLEGESPGEGDAVCISGMGGIAVAEILERAPLLQSKTVVQPNTEIAFLRRALQKMGYGIDDERMVFDNGRFYQVIKLSAGEMQLSKAEELLGPVLLRQKPEILGRYVQRQIMLLERALEGAKDDPQDSVPILSELKIMKEAKSWLAK